MQLQGRNVVLTGTSHGISLHIADALAQAGRTCYNVVISAIVDSRSELIVTPRPMRPLLALAALSPSFANWVYRLSGAADLYREMAQQESTV